MPKAAKHAFPARTPNPSKMLVVLPMFVLPAHQACSSLQQAKWLVNPVQLGQSSKPNPGRCVHHVDKASTKMRWEGHTAKHAQKALQRFL